MPKFKHSGGFFSIKQFLQQIWNSERVYILLKKKNKKRLKMYSNIIHFPQSN